MSTEFNLTIFSHHLKILKSYLGIKNVMYKFDTLEVTQDENGNVVEINGSFTMRSSNPGGPAKRLPESAEEHFRSMVGFRELEKFILVRPPQEPTIRGLDHVQNP